MTPLGLPSLDKISALPTDVLAALRTIPEIVENTAAMKEHTAQLGRVADALDRVAGDTAALPGLREEMAEVNGATDVLGGMAARLETIEAAMPVLVEVQGHLAALPETMGCKGGEHGLLTFTDAVVPADNLLGEEGDGIGKMEEALEISRVFVAASSLGTAEYALDLSIEHSKRRTTFGRPIADRQAVQRYLAEMEVDVHALRLLIDDAAVKWDSGRRIPKEAAICKLFGLEAVGRVTDRALLVHGGIGYTRRHPIERLYRDARLNWLEEGTPTIQQLVIAREILGGNGKGARRG